MAGKDIIRMSQQELKKHVIIKQIISKKLKQKEASEMPVGGSHAGH